MLPYRPALDHAGLRPLISVNRTGHTVRLMHTVPDSISKLPGNRGCLPVLTDHTPVRLKIPFQKRPQQILRQIENRIRQPLSSRAFPKPHQKHRQLFIRKMHLISCPLLRHAVTEHSVHMPFQPFQLFLVAGNHHPVIIRRILPLGDTIPAVPHVTAHEPPEIRAIQIKIIQLIFFPMPLISNPVPLWQLCLVIHRNRDQITCLQFLYGFPFGRIPVFYQKRMLPGHS